MPNDTTRSRLLLDPPPLSSLHWAGLRTVRKGPQGGGSIDAPVHIYFVSSVSTKQCSVRSDCCYDVVDKSVHWVELLNGHISGHGGDDVVLGQHQNPLRMPAHRHERACTSGRCIGSWPR
jgi:hypothetical protein